MNLTLDYSESGGAPSVPGLENRSKREQQLPSFSVEYSNPHSVRERDILILDRVTFYLSHNYLINLT